MPLSSSERNRWDRRYRERAPILRDPSTHITRHAHRFIPGGRVLDVAGGDGRNGLWLAARGLEVTIVDISSVGLAQAGVHAAEQGVRVRTVLADLDTDPVPPGPWHVIVDCYFLSRALVSRLLNELAHGGYFVMVHPTRSNLERHTSPSAEFLLNDGELRLMIERLDKSGLEIIEYDEGWQENGRHEARVVVRRR